MIHLISPDLAGRNVHFLPSFSLLQPKQELGQEKEEKILQELKELKEHCKLVKCLAFGRDVSIEVTYCPNLLLLFSAPFTMPLQCSALTLV